MHHGCTYNYFSVIQNQNNNRTRVPYNSSNNKTRSYKTVIITTFQIVTSFFNKRIQRARYEEFIFQLADAYADYPLYLPAFLDFRGRIYRSGVLHFHERDLAKSLIIFSNSEKDINEINNFSENRIDSGIYNLAIATGFKYQKFSNYKESYDWIKNELIPNQSNILEFARNADDPFQFLSKALYLLYFISENEKGTSFYSSDLRYLLRDL